MTTLYGSQLLPFLTTEPQTPMQIAVKAGMKTDRLTVSIIGRYLYTLWNNEFIERCRVTVRNGHIVHSKKAYYLRENG